MIPATFQRPPERSVDCGCVPDLGIKRCQKSDSVLAKFMRFRSRSGCLRSRNHSAPLCMGLRSGAKRSMGAVGDAGCQADSPLPFHNGA